MRYNGDFFFFFLWEKNGTICVDLFQPVLSKIDNLSALTRLG